MYKRILAMLLAAGAASPLTYAENCQPFTGADTLQQLVSGATAEIELKPGVIAVGRYNADGTAEIEAWNDKFPRIWSVKDDDQVCYSNVETNCYTFEQNVDEPGEYRATNVKSGEVFVFRVTDPETRTFSRETPPNDEGSRPSSRRAA